MMSEREYVLVVVPTYNRAEYLAEAVNSVFAQDYPYIRLAIVDDGSEDGTRDLYRELHGEPPRIVSYHYKPNGGCASARNFGLRFLDESIRYVCFLDSDDKMMPGKLSGEIGILRENPDAAFCYSDYILFDEETGSEVLKRPASPGNPSLFAIEHFLTNNAKPGAVLYRAGVFADKRFDEDLKYNEDSDLLQRVAIEHKSLYSPYPGCWVRIHRGAKSKNRVEVYKAVLSVNRGTIKAYPDFYKQHQEAIDLRMKKIEGDLFAELALRGHWKEAALHAKGFRKRVVLCLRLGAYYRIKRLLNS
jgi:glycosyltransferase involved in cell wall biosynthesis